MAKCAILFVYRVLAGQRIATYPKKKTNQTIKRKEVAAQKAAACAAKRAKKKK